MQTHSSRRLLIRAVILWVAVTYSSADRVAGQAGPKAPTGLVAVSANRNAVSLSWTANDPQATRYSVERKQLGAQWPTRTAASPTVTVTAANSTALNDTTIDPFTTYVYRVRTVGANNAMSPPSNEIIVKPPSVDFSQIL